MTTVYFAVLADHKDEEVFDFSTKYAQSGRQAAFYGKQLLDNTMFAAKFIIHKRIIKPGEVTMLLNDYIPKPVTGFSISADGWIKECH